MSPERELMHKIVKHMTECSVCQQTILAHMHLNGEIDLGKRGIINFLIDKFEIREDLGKKEVT